MPRPLNFDDAYMLDLYIECGAMFGKISNHPRTQIRSVKSLKRIAQENNWAARSHNILAEASVRKSSKARGNLIADRKIEALETIAGIKSTLKDLLSVETDKDGNKYFKLDGKKLSYLDAVKAWSKMTEVEMSLLGENKLVVEIHHIVEEKMTVIMELVFKTIQQVADEKIIDDNAVRRIFELCGETVTAKALGLEGSGSDTD